MDIDVTRKLRPQKASEFSAPAISGDADHPADLEGKPPAGLVKTSAPPGQPGFTPSMPSRDEEAYTIRFAASAPAAENHELALAEPDPVTGWLIVMGGPGRGRSLPLGYGIHSVGRGEEQRVSVRFGDKRISRRSHVDVVYDANSRAFFVCPGRAGGTALGYLNGQALLQPSPLRAGDRITLGATELAFVPFCGESFDWQAV
jgi:hypothetical protein